MVLENYCRKCGCRILPNEHVCSNCGLSTGRRVCDDLHIMTPPIHNIGFFNFDIDFAPYILSKKRDFKYEICSCGYLNEVDNEYCYMCGAKRSHGRLSKIFKKKSKPQFTIGNILCECGTVNSKDNVYCDMCGKQLRDDSNSSFDNYSNFNLEFDESVFCFCGEENEKFALFCKNCGFPLKNYGVPSDISILCTCSTLNEITSDYCIECGANLNRENSILSCVCGHKNKRSSKHCEVCERLLNPARVIKSRIVCSCGEILEWNSEFCPNCGNNIKRTIARKKSIRGAVKSIKSILR